jgi:hypothetical protein
VQVVVVSGGGGGGGYTVRPMAPLSPHITAATTATTTADNNGLASNAGPRPRPLARDLHWRSPPRARGQGTQAVNAVTTHRHSPRASTLLQTGGPEVCWYDQQAPHWYPTSPQNNHVAPPIITIITSSSSNLLTASRLSCMNNMGGGNHHQQQPF